MTSGEVAVAPTSIPKVPARIRACLAGEGYIIPAGDLPDGDMSVRLAVEVIANLKASEINKTACGREAIRFADDIRSKIGGVK